MAGIRLSNGMVIPDFVEEQIQAEQGRQSIFSNNLKNQMLGVEAQYYPERVSNQAQLQRNSVLRDNVDTEGYPTQYANNATLLQNRVSDSTNDTALKNQSMPYLRRQIQFQEDTQPARESIDLNKMQYEGMNSESAINLQPQEQKTKGALLKLNEKNANLGYANADMNSQIEMDLKKLGLEEHKQNIQKGQEILDTLGVETTGQFLKVFGTSLNGITTPDAFISTIDNFVGQSKNQGFNNILGTLKAEAEKIKNDPSEFKLFMDDVRNGYRGIAGSILSTPAGKYYAEMNRHEPGSEAYNYFKKLADKASSQYAYGNINPDKQKSQSITDYKNLKESLNISESLPPYEDWFKQKVKEGWYGGNTASQGIPEEASQDISSTDIDWESFNKDVDNETKISELERTQQDIRKRQSSKNHPVVQKKLADAYAKATARIQYLQTQEKVNQAKQSAHQTPPQFSVPQNSQFTPVPGRTPVPMNTPIPIDQRTKYPYGVYSEY